MSKKNKQKHKDIITVPLPWWKKAWAKFTFIPLGAIVGVCTLAYSYKATDANELSKDVYQPLYADLVEVETSINAIKDRKSVV